MPFRQQVYEHSGSYQTIPATAPQGLTCLKALFQEEDADTPAASNLNTILAQDFRDVENGSERSKGRSDIISLIMSRRSRYRKYQTDIAQTWCLINANKTQTVLFEGIRFIMFRNDTEWIRIPISGRIEVRTISRGGKPAGEIVFRKMTLDLTPFWKRKNELSFASPSLSDEVSKKQLVLAPPLPPVYEMPTSTSPTPPFANLSDTGQLEPDRSHHKQARNSISGLGRIAGMKFWKEKTESTQLEHRVDNECSNIARGPEYQDHESILPGESFEHTPHAPEQRRFMSSMD